MLRVCVKSGPLAVAALIVATAAFSTGASRAEAGCGEYVHLGRGMELADMTGHAPQDASSESGREDHAPFAPPCRGPNCRQKAPAPDLPVPGPTTSAPDDKAFLEDAGLATTQGPRLAPSAADLPRNEIFGGRIERPPRIGS